MKRLRYIFFVMLISAVCFGASLNVFAQEETMTNAEVISLVKAGLSTTIIINKIRSSKSNFDLSTDGLIALKQAGVTDEVVGAMLEAKTGKTLSVANTANPEARPVLDPNDPKAPHDFGIYLYEENGEGRRMTQIMPTVSAQNRTGGLFTSSLTYGISKVKVKANLPGPASKTQLKQARPVFYFYLDAKSGGLNTSSGIPSNPNEFALIRFNVRSDNREVTIAKSNAFGGKGGLSDEYVVQFDAEDLGNGVFKITPKGDLKNGEYGFFLINSGNSNTSNAVGSKFFDFGIKLMP